MPAIPISVLGVRARAAVTARRAADRMIAAISEAVDEARAAGVPEDVLRARLDGLAAESRQIEETARRADRGGR